MSQPYFTLLEYIKYRWRAVGAHGLQSPFLFRFYNEVIKQKDLEKELTLLKLRREISDNNQVITFTDPKSNSQKTIETRSLVKNVASSHNFSYFLHRLINHLQYESVLETGTSLGLNAMYMALSDAKEVTTIEGSKDIAEIAGSNFKENNLDKIKLVIGNVQDIFESVLKETKPELVFLDADHRSETIQFYLSTINQAKVNVKCLIIHDIYWSRDMTSAWQQVIKNPAYNLTIDIFQAGIVFPDYPIEKQHFTLKF